MQPIKPTAACPHCGGTSGFTTHIIFKAVRSTSWDGKSVDTDDYQVTSETNPKCADCGRPVRALFRIAAA